MTANDILNNALGLLGYVENNGGVQSLQRIYNRALPIVNLVYGDILRMEGIEKPRIKSLEDEIELSDKAIDVFACGIAAYIAASEGDDNAQALWMAEYQARRTTLTKVTEIKDVLPIPEY